MMPAAAAAEDGLVFDVAVIGGGVVGSATAWRAAKRLAADKDGEKRSSGGVLLVERFEAGHANGSSHGDGRIFRVAYEEADYVALAQYALEAWRELEAETNEDLLLMTGGLTIATKENASTLDDLCTTFTRFGFAHERLSAAAANARFPQYHLDEEAGEEAVFQASAGVLRATPAVRAMWRAAAALGAVAMEGERMTELRVVVDKGGGGDGGEGGGGTDAATVVEITTAAGRVFRARSVVLAMGAWTTRVPGLATALPLQITEETVGYFEPKPGSGSGGVDHTYRSMPIFVHRAPNGIEAGGRADQGYYGVPEVEISGVKVAAHHVGPVVDPDARMARTEDAEANGVRAAREKALATTAAFVARVFPHLDATPSHTLTCLYSVTPDHDFVLDAHPTLPQVYVAAGFSGHGFKFAPALGEVIACLALAVPFPSPLLEQAMAKGRFSLARFAQKEGSNKEEQKHVYR